MLFCGWKNLLLLWDDVRRQSSLDSNACNPIKQSIFKLQRKLYPTNHAKIVGEESPKRRKLWWVEVRALFSVEVEIDADCENVYFSFFVFNNQQSVDHEWRRRLWMGREKKRIWLLSLSVELLNRNFASTLFGLLTNQIETNELRISWELSKERWDWRKIIIFCLISHRKKKLSERNIFHVSSFHLNAFRCLHSSSHNQHNVQRRWIGESLNSPITYLKTLKLLFIWNDINENARRLFISWTEYLVRAHNSTDDDDDVESEMMMRSGGKKSWRMFTTCLAIIWDDYENYSLFETMLDRSDVAVLLKWGNKRYRISPASTINNQQFPKSEESEQYNEGKLTTTRAGDFLKLYTRYEPLFRDRPSVDSFNLRSQSAVRCLFHSQAEERSNMWVRETKRFLRQHSAHDWHDWIWSCVNNFLIIGY